jgi:Secretion system C-terminal sorting domain
VPEAQEELYYPGEMYLATDSVTPPSQTLTFTIEAQGSVWAGSDTPISYWISTEYNTSTFIPQANNEWPPSYWRGWDFVTDITNNPPYPIPIYAYGLYKLTTNHSGEYFYLDFRDDRYGYYQQPTNGHPIDLWIRYNASAQKFSYSSSGSAYEDFITISKGAYIPIWEMKQKGLPSTSLFPLYLTVSSQSGYPYLQWNEYNSTVSGYYIHKILTTEFGTTTSQYFTTLINWTDVEFILGNPKTSDDFVEYWITAKLSPTQQSLEGNHVMKYGTDWYVEKTSNKSNNVNDYTLKQNYPNPFNPITNISYSIKSAGLVILKVYDMLGTEVASLVNEIKEAGTHSVIFNAEGLPSGVYLYKIESDNFLKIRKMILLK